MDKDIPLRAELSKGSHSPHVVQSKREAMGKTHNGISPTGILPLNMVVIFEARTHIL